MTDIEDKKKYKMMITVETDFKFENEFEEDITEYVEGNFQHVMNERIHDRILGYDEFHFWLLEKFRNRTGLEDVKEISDLGALTIRATKLEEVVE